MATVTICSDFGAQENKVSHFIFLLKELDEYIICKDICWHLPIHGGCCSSIIDHMKIKRHQSSKEALTSIMFNARSCRKGFIDHSVKHDFYLDQTSYKLILLISDPISSCAHVRNRATDWRVCLQKNFCKQWCLVYISDKRCFKQKTS